MRDGHGLDANDLANFAGKKREVRVTGSIRRARVALTGRRERRMCSDRSLQNLGDDRYDHREDRHGELMGR